MNDYYPRMRNAADLVKQFERFVSGIREHPQALYYGESGVWDDFV